MKAVYGWLLAAGWAIGVDAAAGSAALMDAAQLAEQLRKDQPCCVVDARAQATRALYPVAFSVEYTDSIKPKPGAYALVIGESDQKALEIAQAISRRSGQDAYAVKGGYATWQKVQPGGEQSSGTTLRSFTIPSNTCEQGPALHEYK